MVGSINGSGKSSLRFANKAGDAKNQNLKNLSTGKKDPKKNAAGAALAAQLLAQEVIEGQAAENVDFAKAFGDIREGALSTVRDGEIAKAELATQLGNSFLNDSQRAVVNENINQITQEQQATIARAEFNGQNVFEASSVQGNGFQIEIPEVDTSNLVSSGDVLTPESSRALLDSSLNSLSQSSVALADTGAALQRAQVVQDESKSKGVQLAAARSRIEDIDIAEETAKLAANSILQQSAIAVLAHDEDRLRNSFSALFQTNRRA